MSNKKIFLVVGMHRSGTSLVANCASSLGLQLSDKLVEASSDNVDGFFEDQAIVDLNIKLEKALNRSHIDLSGMLPMPEDWLEDSVVAPIVNKIKSYIKSCVSEYDNFLIKDPRLCRLLPLYIEIFKDLQLSPIIIYVYRHPASVVRSKSKRDNVSETFVETHWQLSNLEALSEVFRLKLAAYFLSYEQLLKEPTVSLKKLKGFLENNGVSILNEDLPEIRNSSLAVNLKNDKSSTSLQKISISLYNFLNKIEKSEDCYSSNHVEGLSKLSKKFQLIFESAEPWMVEIRKNSKNLNNVQAQERKIKRLESTLKEANGKSFGLNTQLNNSAGVIEKLKSSNSELLNVKKTLQTDKLKVEKKYKETNSSYNESLAKLKYLQESHKNLEFSFKGLENKHTDLRTSYTDLGSDLMLKTQEHDRLTDDHKSLELNYRRLSLKQKTKIFRIANKFQNIKERIYSYLRQFVMKLKNIFFRLCSLSLKFMRSIHNRGVTKTLKISAFALKNRLRRIKNTNKTQPILLDELLDDNSQAKYGPIDWKRINLSEDQIKIVLTLFVREYYVLVAGLDEEADLQDALSHFINIGFDKGLSPGPMFNGDTYISRLNNKTVDKQDAFKHWLLYGFESRIIPTVLFDERFYLARHSLVLPDNEWSFHRFISISIHNNATPNQYFESNWYAQHHDLKELSLPLFYHYLLVGSKMAWRPSPMFPCFSRSYCEQIQLSPMELMMSEVGFDKLSQRLHSSTILQDQISKAAEIESKVYLPKGSRRLNILPFSNPLFPAIRDIRKAIKHTNYDNIVLIPHCRYGGSGLVAGELCRSLLRLQSGSKLLLVRTDNDDFMRPDWFPSGIDILNLRDFSCDLPDSHRKKLLLDILIGLKPNRIFNVHSRLGWEVFVEFGDRLKKWSGLYGYTFCYDVNALGAKVGYPVKYVPDAMENLDHLLVDNSYLKTDLIKANNKWDKNTSNKINVIWTPFQGAEIPDGVLKETPDREKNQRKKVFWAGRFDRQKRFDIVIKLAKNNPDLDFMVWGAAMLGDEDITQGLPGNIQLNGLFESYAEIPFQKCDVWLYTSQWDGVPTILIELGLREVPLVATQVWGTADLITNETAYAVDDVLNVSAYEVAIHQALKNPDKAKERAEKMKSLILRQHSRSNYDQVLFDCFQADDRSNK